MAWFQNLAGRAEDLLNKIDKNAATVLNEPNNKPPENEDSLLSVSYVDERNTDSAPDKLIPKNTDSVTSNNSTKTSLDEENQRQAIIIVDNSNLDEETVEETHSNDNRSSRSSSMHNSFILPEEVQNYDEKIANLELENHELNKQILNLQHVYSELRNENSNLQSQIQVSNCLVQTAQSEMEQYKARAQRILQEKEELRSLQSQNNPDETNNALSKYTEELKKELEFQESKNGELAETLKKMQQDLNAVQHQLVQVQSASQASSVTLHESLAQEKKFRLTAEEDCRVKCLELQLKSQELMQQYEIIRLKNEEIDQLKETFKQRTNNNSNDDFENRIKSLTNTLMLKQNALETVTTERNALRLQLEKLENEYHKNLTQLERAQVRVINVNDTDDVKSQVPQFMRVSPFDAGVTRRVKHAYSTVDAISIRTGIFLRRYPLARVLVFCYMVLLQFWVLMILFLYAPSSR